MGGRGWTWVDVGASAPGGPDSTPPRLFLPLVAYMERGPIPPFTAPILKGGFNGRF